MRIMALDQQSLVATLTASMNDCPTSWIVYGPFEVAHIAGRLLNEVPVLSGSRSDYDGFARGPRGAYRWIFVDADRGSAAFIIPTDDNDLGNNLRGPLQALSGGLNVTPCIYGNVNDAVWTALGGAGRRKVVTAQEFLP
ncbi:hypothetical protein JCM13591A_21690 [Microbacterium xylanilyticum]